MRYSAWRLVFHGLAWDCVVGRHWSGFPLLSSGSWWGSNQPKPFDYTSPVDKSTLLMWLGHTYTCVLIMMSSPLWLETCFCTSYGLAWSSMSEKISTLHLKVRLVFALNYNTNVSSSHSQHSNPSESRFKPIFRSCTSSALQLSYPAIFMLWNPSEWITV